MQLHFEQFVGKQRRLERKFLCISDAELLRFDRVNVLALQGQGKAQLRLIYVNVLDISNFVMIRYWL